MDFINSLRDALLCIVNENIDQSLTNHVTIIKRNRELSMGDFVVIAQSKGKTGAPAAQNFTSTTLTDALKYSPDFEVIPQTKANECAVKLRRSVFSLKVLREVNNAANTYGSNQEGAGKKVVLNSVLPVSNELEALRCLFLTEHLGNLLHNNGYTTKTAVPSCKQLSLEDFNLQFHNSVTSESKNPKDDVNKVKAQLEASAYRLKDGSGDAQEEDGIVLDTHKFIADNSLLTGKDGYDKNLKSIKMSEPLQGRLSDMCMACGEEKEDTDLCVHVVSDAQEYTQQQVDLAWRIINSQANCRQAHQVVGSVSARKSGAPAKLPSLEEFLSIRREQMMEASKLKYGDKVTGSCWMETITELTVAGIKFEFLSTSCRSQLKLDLSSEGPVDSRGGVFVMYNYARIATLLEKFEQDVKEGTYPAIPSIDELDFTLLKDEEEWSLLFNYVMLYPSLLKETVADLKQDHKLRGVFHTHKVCHFLSDLSRDLSSYYRRVRILTDARPHLYPAMHCRLLLLQAVCSVMKNALLLLGIQPMSQL